MSLAISGSKNTFLPLLINLVKEMKESSVIPEVSSVSHHQKSEKNHFLIFIIAAVWVLLISFWVGSFNTQ